MLPNKRFNATAPPPAGPRVNLSVGPKDMSTPDDYISLNVPGLLGRYVNPSETWHSTVQAFAETQLRLFRQYGLINESAPALAVPVSEAVVRFSDYTSNGKAFVRTGAVDKWLASCDRKRDISSYSDTKPLERRIKAFLAQQGAAPDPHASAPLRRGVG